MTLAAIDDVLAWALAAFFLLGAGINGVAPKSIRSDYARWGYPNWFHYVTAALELAVTVGLSLAATKPWAALLGAAVMASAVGTTLYHREPKRAVAPTVVLFLTAALAWIALTRAPDSPTGQLPFSPPHANSFESFSARNSTSAVTRRLGGPAGWTA